MTDDDGNKNRVRHGGQKIALYQHDSDHRLLGLAGQWRDRDAGALAPTVEKRRRPETAKDWADLKGRSKSPMSCSNLGDAPKSSLKRGT
jgi:hypothetical protein